MPGSGWWSYAQRTSGGQRHQDRLGASAGAQAEEGAAVVDQVELDVAAAAEQLPLAVRVGRREVHAALENRQVSGDERGGAVAHEGEKR